MVGPIDLAGLEAVERVLTALARWGLVDYVDGAPVTSGRWKAALMRAARSLGDEEARGSRIPGHPLHNATARAFAGLDVVPAAERDLYVSVLVALEVREMPPALRAAMGFADP